MAARKKAKKKLGKKKKDKLAKKKEQFFVSNFLRQPGKTRSGITYTNKQRKSSSECIFGSLLANPDNAADMQAMKTKALQTAKDQCNCKQCIDKRKKEELTTCRSNHSGLSIFLKSEEQSAKTSQSDHLKPKSSAGIFKSLDTFSYKSKSDSKVYGAVQKKLSSEKNKIHEPEYCKCKECSDTSEGNDGLRQKNFSKKSTQQRKRSALKKTKRRSKHQLEQSVPRRKTKVKIVQKQKKKKIAAAKQKGAKRSKSLLKFVLKKKNRSSNLSLNPSSNSNHQTCQCCQRFFDVLVKSLSEEKLKKKRGSKKKKIAKESSKERILKQWKPCCGTKKCCNQSPLPSSGVVSDLAVNSMNSESDSEPSTSGINTSNILFPSLGVFKHRDFDLNKKITKPIVQTPCLDLRSMTKKPRKGTNKQNAKKSGKGKKKGKVTTKKVTRKTQATQKKRPSPTGVKTKQTRKPKKATKKKSLQIAPMPRAEHSRGKEKRRKRKHKSAKKNKDGETRSSTSEKFPFSPVPSARIPTFIAMVKTAIRDLKPFRITGRDAIARYIQIRYRVRNDDLLKYVLKWLVDMGVLTVKDKNYLFVGKRLVTKKTVAIVRKSKKTALQQLLRKRKMKKLKKKKHKRSSKKLKERSRRSKKMKHRKSKRSKRSKRCKSKKCSKKRKKCRNAKCTCSKELKSRKNRIKWKTRYIRKNGKIYKQDEYV